MDRSHVQEVSSASSSGSGSRTRPTSSTGPKLVSEPKYRVIAELGRGGMANVYLALARGVGGFSKLVVLKCIRPDMASETEFVTMLMDEARLAACLSHPNIVQTNEIIDHNGAPVIVMEYLEGHTLYDILRYGRRTNQSMPRAMHLHILIEVLRGLHYAHEAKDLHGKPLNLVHRDMSPQNILVTYSGEVKILDFGVAKSAEASHETRAGVLKGKIRYMAPEQVVAANVDRRADVYSVGVLLWQALAGRDYWQGQSDLDVMQAIVSEALPSLREAAPDLPDEAERVIAGALAYNVDDRYPTAAIFGEKIAELIKFFGPKPEPRDLELYIEGLFSADRERKRALIAESIGRAQNDSCSGVGEIVFSHQIGTGGGPLFPTNATPAGLAGEAAPSAIQPRGRRKLWVSLGATLGLAAAVGTYQYTRAAHRVAPVQPMPATAPRPERIPVSVRISATPSDARLFLDGAPLPNNPYEETLLPDGNRHIVRAELSGYVPRQETFELKAEVMVSIALEREAAPSPVVLSRSPLPAAPAPRAPAVARPRAAPAPSTTTSNLQTGSDCDPPYYTDPNGIRRIRPGCS